MHRYKLTIEYEGTPFVGWQYQTNGLSIQEAIERALERFCGQHIRVHGAGRTDSGVHALGQCCHVDLPRETSPATLTEALNAHLRPDLIAVLDSELVSPSFDARRDAVERRYVYRIINRRARLALFHNRAWHVARPLNATAMAEAASWLIGTHDFTTFRAAQCQASSPIRTLKQLDVTRTGEQLNIHAHARSFVHHQVRAIVGTLVQVGDGTRKPEEVNNALMLRNRSLCGPTAPAHGLYLKAVIYPKPT